MVHARGKDAHGLAVERMKQLFAVGFRGPLIIEREILPGPEQDADILSAVKLLKELRGTVTA